MAKDKERSFFRIMGGELFDFGIMMTGEVASVPEAMLKDSGYQLPGPSIKQNTAAIQKEVARQLAKKKRR